jgi:16S rRNA (cytidine1402-2'-O)-methyltransferase
VSIENGVLYVVGTPIGNLGDMSPRARAVLSEVQVIAAEDTRHSGRLLRHFGISTPMLPLHEHNERQVAGAILERLRSGQSVALISDAGTPLVSDPGFPLVRAARDAGFRISPVPGPNAAICALSAAGLPSDRFFFEGFLPRSDNQRRERLHKLRLVTSTLIFYETGQRVVATLRALSDRFGGQRPAVIARELTKLHETFIGGTLAELERLMASKEMERKGEMVLLVSGAVPAEGRAAFEEAERVLEILLQELPVKQAAALAARISGGKKNELYTLALEKRRS